MAVDIKISPTDQSAQYSALKQLCTSLSYTTLLKAGLVLFVLIDISFSFSIHIKTKSYWLQRGPSQAHNDGNSLFYLRVQLPRKCWSC